MGLTRLPFKVITVAGTNGKGSSCAMAASILMAPGYKVGVYSSPQLLRFTDTLDRWLMNPPASGPLFLPLLLSPQGLARFVK